MPRAGRLVLLVCAVGLSACAKEEAKSDPLTAQLVADGAVLVAADLGDGWTVQPAGGVVDALQTCSVPEGLGVPVGAAVSDPMSSASGTATVGSVHMWASAGQANAALGTVLSDEFALCVRTAFVDSTSAAGGKVVDRRKATDRAPQRGNGSVRSRIIFVTERSDGTRVEIDTDIVRVRRGAATVTTVSTGPSRVDDATDVLTGLDAMLNRVALG